jgi:glycosyltransferase involved in cell wall biosynthesis
MKIAVDARELAGRPTGVGRYLAEILRCWQHDPAAARHEIVLLAHTAFDWPGTGAGARITTEIVPGSGRVWWEQRALAAAVWRLKADVLFCPGYSGPLLARTPMVVTLHDVSFWAHPEWFSRRESLRRRATTLAVSRRARLILTVSQFSRDEIVHWLGAPEDRIRVVHNGIGLATPDSTGPGPGAAGPPVILTVGTILNRRHVDVLIRAFAQVASAVPDARLVIVGDNRTHPHQDLAALARELQVEGAVDLRSYVSDEELRSLYAQARAFAFLSTYEGFGMTPLEALAAGIPTVVYDTPVAREVYGSSAEMVPIGNVDALAARLREMLTLPDDPIRRARIVDNIRTRYTWSRAANETLAALEEAARP